MVKWIIFWYLQEVFACLGNCTTVVKESELIDTEVKENMQ